MLDILLYAVLTCVYLIIGLFISALYGSDTVISTCVVILFWPILIAISFIRLIIHITLYIIKRLSEEHKDDSRSDED